MLRTTFAFWSMMVFLAVLTVGFPAITTAELALILVAGFCLFAGNLLIVRAYRVGAASFVAPFQYCLIFWGALNGWLVFGASVYFPPLFKAVLLGFFIWLFLHRQLRDWMYAGDIWHPLLMDLSLFALSVCLALVLLIAW